MTLAKDLADGIIADAIRRKFGEGKNAITVCHELELKRWELGSHGFGTGPWTGEMWDAECRRRGYRELVYGRAPE